MLCVPVQTDDAYRAKSWGLTKAMGYCQRLKHMMHVVIAVSHTAGLTALLQSGCLPVLTCSASPSGVLPVRQGRAAFGVNVEDTLPVPGSAEFEAGRMERMAAAGL